MNRASTEEAELMTLRWAAICLEASIAGMQNRRGLTVTNHPANSDPELWNAKSALASLQSVCGKWDPMEKRWVKA